MFPEAARVTRLFVTRLSDDIERRIKCENSGAARSGIITATARAKNADISRNTRYKTRRSKQTMTFPIRSKGRKSENARTHAVTFAKYRNNVIRVTRKIASRTIRDDDSDLSLSLCVGSRQLAVTFRYFRAIYGGLHRWAWKRRQPKKKKIR